MFLKVMFYAQYNQDKFLETYVFKGYKNGFFIDVGAHNGKSINNTLYFEKNNNWTGINIEPIKNVYDKLIVNRPNSININCAVSNNDGDTRHNKRLGYENNKYGSTTQIIKIETKRLQTICDTHNISHINYLSIDVAGGGFEVIKSINFDKVFIDIIGFENNYDDTSIPIIKYLEDRNYVVIYKSLDIFMLNKKSVFPKNL